MPKAAVQSKDILRETYTTQTFQFITVKLYYGFIICPCLLPLTSQPSGVTRTLCSSSFFEKKYFRRKLFLSVTASRCIQVKTAICLYTTFKEVKRKAPGPAPACSDITFFLKRTCQFLILAYLLCHLTISPPLHLLQFSLYVPSSASAPASPGNQHYSTSTRHKLFPKILASVKLQ